MGDVEKGFAEADVIVEREFETSRYHQGYIEPHNATAYWSEDGHLSIWTSTQGLFGVRGSLSEVLHDAGLADHRQRRWRSAAASAASSASTWSPWPRCSPGRPARP